MGNLSYCRFENTYKDLRDCYNALSKKGLDELSNSEKEYARSLIKMCSEISGDFSDIEDSDEWNDSSN